MPLLSKKLLHTLEAVLDIALHGAGRPMRSKALAQRHNIPPRYLEPVMRELVRAGILAGLRGPRGGYRLARERRRITVAEVVRAIAACDYVAEDQDGAAASLLAEKIIKPLWRELETMTMARLESVTLEDLCRQARASGIENALDIRLDFSI